MNDKFYIAESDVGKGLFAKRKIKTCEEILLFEGSMVTGKQARDLDIRNYGKPLGNALQVGKDKYIYLKDPERIVNHSCDPNTGIKNDKRLIAIKDIEKDEEIRFDYSTTMDEDYWTMECKCGQKNCRGIVKDFKYLPKPTRDKYLRLGIVQKFITEKYKNRN